jgi:hypothetical protein
MKNFYCTLEDKTLTYGEIQQGEHFMEIPVYFERDDKNGDFDFAEGLIPQCTFSRSRGFSELELNDLSSFLRDNERIIFDMARGLR